MFSLQSSPPISELPYILMILFFVAKIYKVLMESICLSLFLFPVLQRILYKQPCKSQCPQVSWCFVVVIIWTLYLEALVNLFILIASLDGGGSVFGVRVFLGGGSLWGFLHRRSHYGGRCVSTYLQPQHTGGRGRQLSVN